MYMYVGRLHPSPHLFLLFLLAFLLELEVISSRNMAARLKYMVTSTAYMISGSTIMASVDIHYNDMIFPFRFTLLQKWERGKRERLWYLIQPYYTYHTWKQ